MPFAASYSKAADLDEAVTTVCDSVQMQLGGERPHLSVAFVSHAHSRAWGDLPQRIRERTGTGVLIGCTGETIVGGGEEIEEGPALSLWSAVLPGIEITPFRVQFARTPDGLVCSGVPSDLELVGGRGVVLCLGEPYTSAPGPLLERFAMELPGVPVLGGMASGGVEVGDNRLMLDSDVVPTGAVGVVLHGAVRVRSVVSQGCRPIGEPFVVTAAERNVVHQLGGAPPLQRLQEMLPTLSERDQSLVRNGLHLGLAMNEYQATFRRGDFLIANVIGADAESGAIAIGNLVRTGQTVQFHVRDAQTADEDLRHLLRQDTEAGAPPAQAALLFSCNGRGTRLFSEPNHDAAVLQELCGPLPLAGLFAQGELGPVGGRNYIHGYTASVALFE